MTPDELRADEKQWSENHLCSESMLAAAAAWEADRKRLEAAEKQMRHMRAWSRQDMTGLTMAQVTDAFMRLCDDGLAALAAGKSAP